MIYCHTEMKQDYFHVCVYCTTFIHTMRCYNTIESNKNVTIVERIFPSNVWKCMNFYLCLWMFFFIFLSPLHCQSFVRSFVRSIFLSLFGTSNTVILCLCTTNCTGLIRMQFTFVHSFIHSLNTLNSHISLFNWVHCNCTLVI